ncbi:MAG: hypothetical protein M1827_001371 [Pycnora praestabilis]|nr:MAG: hypothetical protein M1827_001371 [Pycnora praestabilis]
MSSDVQTLNFVGRDGINYSITSSADEEALDARLEAQGQEDAYEYPYAAGPEDILQDAIDEGNVQHIAKCNMMAIVAITGRFRALVYLAIDQVDESMHLFGTNEDGIFVVVHKECTPLPLEHGVTNIENLLVDLAGGWQNIRGARTHINRGGRRGGMGNSQGGSGASRNDSGVIRASGRSRAGNPRHSVNQGRDSGRGGSCEGSAGSTATTSEDSDW